MRPARPALTQEQQQMVRRLRGEGMTWQKAARAVGCSFTSAWFIGEGRGGRHARPASWTPRPGSLTIADREEITIGLVKGESFTAIARRINKVPSTVSREVAANGGRDDYRAWAGYLRAEQRCRRPKPTKLASCPQLLSEVTAGLKGFWSPQEISRRLRIDFADDPMMQVSHETIYQSLFVQARGELRRELTRCLRSGRATRRPQGSRSKVNFRMPNMVMISERPAEVADRAVPGHWEGDLIMGKDNLSAVGHPGGALHALHIALAPRCRQGRLVSQRGHEEGNSHPAVQIGQDHHLGPGRRDGPTCRFHNRDQHPRLLLRSPLALATRIERKHQWPAAPIHAKGHRSLSPQREGSGGVCSKPQ